MEMYLGTQWHHMCEELFGVSLPTLPLQILLVNMTTVLSPGLVCTLLLFVAVAFENLSLGRARADSGAHWEGFS